jgi:hypothetical protein
MQGRADKVRANTLPSSIQFGPYQFGTTPDLKIQVLLCVNWKAATDVLKDLSACIIGRNQSENTTD